MNLESNVRWGIATVDHGKGEELKVLPDKFCEVILTDIPYNEVNRKSSGLRRLNRGDADASPVDLTILSEHFSRIATQWAIVWCGQEQVSPLKALFRKMFSRQPRVGAWIKTNPSVMNGDDNWLSGIELCVIGSHSKAPFFGHCEVPYWIGPTQPLDWHPTAKPVWLFREQLFKIAQRGAFVLDPFAGSGASGVASAELGMRWLGMDKDQSYVDKATVRVREAFHRAYPQSMSNVLGI